MSPSAVSMSITPRYVYQDADDQRVNPNQQNSMKCTLKFQVGQVGGDDFDFDYDSDLF